MSFLVTVDTKNGWHIRERNEHRHWEGIKTKEFLWANFLLVTETTNEVH